jgi:hypothetical protein
MRVGLLVVVLYLAFIGGLVFINSRNFVLPMVILGHSLI